MHKKIFIFAVVLIVFAGGLYLAYSFGKKSAEKAMMQQATEQLTKKETPESTPTPSQNRDETSIEQEIPVKVVKVEQQGERYTGPWRERGF